MGNANELAQYDDASFGEIWNATMRRVLAIPEYAAKFKAAYPAVAVEQLGFQHAANAIAAFQVEAFTFIDSPFDRYLAGQNDALSAEAKRGALLFYTESRCSACHFGPLLGSRTFAATATPQVGPGVGNDAPLDRGRSAQIGIQTQSFLFRVPPLRNVELTAPYTHAGAYTTLEAVVLHYNNVEGAIRTYDATQLDAALRPLYHGDEATINALLAALDARLRRPFGLNQDQMKQLVVFLRSLTDPAARDLSGVIPSRVPSGLPVR
jgi:cytochrome c peroxidase